MNVYYSTDIDISDLNNVCLMASEKRMLRKISRKPGIEITNCRDRNNLESCGLIRGLENGEDKYHNVLYGDKCVVTQKYKRYVSYKRKCLLDSIMKSVVAPIIVSIVTTIIVNLLI